MKRIIVQAVSSQSDTDVVHELRNVGEDIYREFHFKGIAEVPNMDSAVTILHIEVKATRHLGEVMTFLKKSLRKNGIADLVQVSRDDSK